MKPQFKEAKEYRTIDKDNKQVLSPSKVVAQCYYQGHPGYLNNKMMIKHKCREKNCKYLALNYNHSLNLQLLKEKYEKYFKTLITLKQVGYISDEMYNYYHKKDYRLMQEFYSLDNWLYKLHKRKQRIKLFKKIKSILLMPFNKIIRAYRKYKWLNRQKKFNGGT